MSEFRLGDALFVHCPNAGPFDEGSSGALE